MTVTKQDVMYALLALDAYNRHTEEDKRKISEGADQISTQIGSATWKKSSDGIEIESGPTLDGSQAAGFSASSYTYNGVDVISYRGTDFPNSWTSGSQLLEFAKDFGAGWLQSFGVLDPDDVELGPGMTLGSFQPYYALKFYKEPERLQAEIADANDNARSTERLAA